MMITTLESIGNQITKVKSPTEGWFCVTFSFWVFLSFTFLSSPKKRIYHHESSYYLQIKHNIRFLPQSEQFYHGLGFFCFFCHYPNEIAKEKKKKKKKKKNN